MMKSLKQFVQTAKHEQDETDRLVQQQTDTIYKERSNLCCIEFNAEFTSRPK